MDTVSTSSNKLPGASGRRRRAIALVWTGIVAFGLGVMVGSSQSSDVGSAPAIDFARELGLALPLEQQPAFADGEITRAEVETAMERLVACADQGDVRGFLIELDDDGGYSSQWSNSDDAGIVQRCRLQQFEATYQIWLHQERTR